MKKTLIIGIVLVVAGLLALGYESISYMTQEEVLDLGSVEVDVEKEEQIPIPRILGIVLLSVGVITTVYSVTTSR